MLAGVAKYLAQKFGCTVDDARLAGEGRIRGHETHYLDDAGDAVEVADDALDGGQGIDGKLEATGKVSLGELGASDEPTVDPEDAKRYAAVCAINALAAVKSVIGDLDRITRIVKVVGFVSSDPSFTGQPGVINGASELLGQVLGDAGQHARSAVGVSVLPLDSPVEVELIAEFS